MGADDQCPMPHTAKGRTADNVVTVVVGFPPHPPLSHVTPSHPLRCRICCRSGHHQTGTPHSTSYSPPPPPSPSSPLIVRDQMPAQIPAKALTCTTPGLRAGCRSRGRAYCCPNVGPVQTIASLGIAIATIVVVVIADMGGGGEWDVGGGGIWVVCCVVWHE